jgi:hypothetical protein
MCGLCTCFSNSFSHSNFIHIDIIMNIIPNHVFENALISSAGVVY